MRINNVGNYSGIELLEKDYVVCGVGYGLAGTCVIFST